ncbi:MAG: hypothetical protein ACJ8M1_00950 [Chthoniobacterales bacterium]
MNDAEFTRAFERGEIRNQDFHHASHLRVAWVYLGESTTLDQAIEKMCTTIRRFATSAGYPEKYHQTITVFWMRVLAALARLDRGADLERVLQENPQLLEKNLSLEYFSRETLSSDRARLGWVEPDLKPLPNATAIRSSSTTSNSSHRLVCR